MNIFAKQRTALCSGAIGNITYLVVGAILFVIKFCIDWSVARSIFGRQWSPADYIAPGASLALLLTAPQERMFYGTMLVIAIPFIAVGVLLTAMRLRSVGIPRGWTVLFFVPGVNIAFFTLLCTLPRRRLAGVEAVADTTPFVPAPSPSVAEPLVYFQEPRSRLSWLNRCLPQGDGSAKLVAILTPVPIALAATFLSIQFLKTYGWGVFVGVPFAIGLMAAVLYSARCKRGAAACIGVGCLSLTLYGLALLFFAFEGAGCLIMAAPLAYPLTAVGAAIGASLGARSNGIDDGRRIVWVMALFLPAFIGAEKLASPPAPLFAVTTSVEIDAPPGGVWANVIGFGEIPAPTEWIFKTGVAYPIRAEISGRGRGAMRYCVFSTGPFVEPIREWDEPRLLKFDVISNPPPMKEWSPYAGVHPPHLESFLVSNGGQFRLVELPGGRTRLEGTTWYRHNMWPAAYWRIWSNYIIHRIHLRVLNHVKMLSEVNQ